MDLINGFGRASSGFGSDPPTGSGQAQGSLQLYLKGFSQGNDQLQFEVFERNLVANRGFTTPNRGKCHESFFSGMTDE